MALHPRQLTDQQRTGQACAYCGTSAQRQMEPIDAPPGVGLLFLFAHPTCGRVRRHVMHHPESQASRPGRTS
jgi:hypothetical protein